MAAPSIGSGSTPAAGDLLICSFAGQSGSLSWTPPSGMTEQGDTTTGWVGAALATQVLSSAGATGTKTATSSGSPSGNYRTVSLAIAQGSSTVNKSGSDTGTGSDTGSITATVTGSDPGTGTDTGGVSVLRNGSDSGTGSESGFVAQAQIGSDTATGTETGSIGATVTSGDTATGTSSGGVLADTTATPDHGTGTESGHIMIPGGDTGAGSVAAVHIDATVTSSDTATGSDGGYVETLFGDLVVALWAVDPTTGTLTALPDYTSLSLHRVRNGAGEISLNYPTTGLNWSVLRNTVDDDRDLEVELWLTGSPTRALRGYLQEASGDDVSEDGTWTFAGGFLELRAGEAEVFPQTAGSVTGNEKQELVFSAETPGAIVRTLLLQAQARGTWSDITAGFTNSVDSDGTSWPSVVTTKFSPGAGYDQVLGKLVDLGLIEWSIEWDGTGKVLNVWVPGGRGTDLTVGLRPIVLRGSRNIVDAPRKWSVRDSGTVVLASGSEGVYESASDADAQTRRGRRIERSASANNLSDSGAVQAYAQAQLATISGGVLEVTHGIGFLPGEPRPVIAFDIGDWIYSQTSTTLDPLRVVEWSLAVDSDQNPSGSVTLNDTVTEAIIRLRDRMDAITSGDTVVGTSASSTDTGVPNPPTDVIASSIAFLQGEQPVAAVTVGWTLPTTNTDGTTITDLSGFSVQWGLGVSPTVWQYGAVVNNGQTNTAQFTTTCGQTISIRVAAFDFNGNQSAWSTPVQHTTASDTTPPPATSAPTVGNYLGVLRVSWDGLTDDGTDMRVAAADFDHVEVHISAASMFTPDATTYFDRLFAAGTVVYTEGVYGTTYFARLVAVDSSGNASGPSGQGSDAPAQVVSADVFDGAIGSAKLADLAVTTAKINDLAVNDAKIGSVAVGKLVAGTLTADVTNSGIIRSATSGARYELDNAGLRLYDSSNSLRVRLQTSDGSALVTGTYQSGLSGTRINILPDGSQRFYGSSGTDYGSIVNSGGVIVFTSMQDPSTGRRSRIEFNPSGLNAIYAQGSTLYSQANFGRTFGTIGAPVVGFRVYANLGAEDGTANRVFFVSSNNGGPSGDLGNSVVHWQTRSFDNFAAFYHPHPGNTGSGLLFSAGAIGVIQGGPDTDNGAIVASAFNPPSSGLVKTTPAPARFGRERELSGLNVIDRVAAPEWSYLFDKQRLRHFGPIAEDLQAVDPDLVSRDYDGRLVVDLRDLLGVAWSAIRELSARSRALEARLAGPDPIVIDGDATDETE